MRCPVTCLFPSGASQGVALHARVHEVDRGQDRRRSGRFGDTFRLGRCEPGSVLATTHWWGCCTVGSSVRSWSVGGHMSCTRVQARDVWDARGRSWIPGRFGDTIRLGRCVPGGWVGHFALVKCYLFAGRIRCSADWLSDNSWSEQVGGGSGSDLDGWGPTRAQVSVIVGVR